MGGAKKELQIYIKQCLGKGYSFKKIERDLILRGYPQRVAEGILLSYRHKGELMKGVVAASLGLLFVVSLFLSGSGIAGMMGLGYSMEFEQSLNIVVNESSSYSWYPQYNGVLTSLSITSNVIDGKGRVYIENNGKKYLIFDSDNSQGVTDITSSSLGKEIRHAEKLCMESCILDGFNRSIYNLVFEVDKGVLEVTRLHYKLEKRGEVLPVPYFLNIPDQEVGMGNVLKVNLSSFFNTSEIGVEYGYISESLDVVVDEGIAVVTPRGNGKTYIYFTALLNGVKFASNLVEIDVVEKADEGEVIVSGNATKDMQSSLPFIVDFRVWIILLFGIVIIGVIIALPARYYDVTGLAVSIDKLRKERGMTKKIVDYNLMKSTLKRKGMDADEKTRLLEEMESAVKDMSKNVPRMNSIREFNDKAKEFERVIDDDKDAADKIYRGMRQSYLRIIGSKVMKKDKDDIYKRLKKYYNLLKK